MVWLGIGTFLNTDKFLPLFFFFFLERMPPQGRGLWGKKKNILELCSDECPTLGHQFPCQTTAAHTPLLEQSGQLDSPFQKMQDRFFYLCFIMRPECVRLPGKVMTFFQHRNTSTIDKV